MRNASTGEIKLLKDAGAGELVIVNDGEARAVAVVLETGTNARLGIVEGTGEQHPYVIFPWSDTTCFSLGRDWLIEPIFGSETFPHHPDTGYRAGLLLQTADGLLMNFATSEVREGGRFKKQWWNLSDMRETSTPHDICVLFSSWRIWENQQTFDHPRVSAIVEFEAKSTKPASREGHRS